MKPLHGPISDRLRRLFHRDDPVWHPPRGTDRPGPIPPTTDGRQISKPNRHT